MNKLSGIFTTAGIFLVIGGGLFFGGLFVSPSATTDDGYNLRYFLFFMGGFFMFMGAAAVSFSTLNFYLRRRRIEKLLEIGQRGKAKILDIKETGIEINDNPRLNFLLEMYFENQNPYRVWKKVTVLTEELYKMQVGSTVNVLGDPNDPQNSKRIEILL